MLTQENTNRGRLLQQYVTARITRMDNINIGLFDYDRYNTLYFFILNSDEQVYMRYGGRDQSSFTGYLKLESLELALEKGLELHNLYKQDKLAKQPAPPELYPREIPELFKRTTQAGRCVECHLIGDLQNVQLEMDGTLDKLVHMYRSPDIKKIGIYLDIPKGLVVHEAKGNVAEAGMFPGDVIRALNGAIVWTFGDLQWEYDQVKYGVEKIELTVERNGKLMDLSVELPNFWWHTDLSYRNLSVEPRIYFSSKPLTQEEKKALNLNPTGFASKVQDIDTLAELLGSHELQIGDIVYGVDSTTHDEIANTADLFIKLRKQAGSTIKLQVLRNKQQLELLLKTERMSFRK